VYIMAYEYQHRVDFDSIVAVEYHLTQEYLLSALLPHTASFYSRVLEKVIPQCRFALFFDSVVFPYCGRVFSGMVAYRPFDVLREWEPFIQETWQKDPWGAVRTTRCFLEKVDPGEEVYTTVHRAYQTYVNTHTALLVRTLSNQSEDTIRWVVRNTTDLEELLGRGYMRHVWRHRAPSMLLEAHEVLEKVGNAFLPLRSLLFDMEESTEHFQYTDMTVMACRDDLQYAAHWPMIAMQSVIIPRWLLERKETFEEVYRERYPHRKITWLDFHSTVELTNGWHLTFPHALVLQEVERRGKTSIQDLVLHFGWDAMLVVSLVQSLPPLMQEGDIVSLSEKRMPPCGFHASLPALLCTPTTRGQGTARHDQDLCFVLQAKVVRFLKREGPQVRTRLQQHVSATKPELLELVLQRLLTNEYVRQDEKGVYHYVP